MTPDRQFVAHAVDLLAPLGEVRPRAMFGGWGLYHGSVMFALIASGRLYLKADAESEGYFAAAGSTRFIYDHGKAASKPVAMSYWEVPADAMEDADALAPWARMAIETMLGT